MTCACSFGSSGRTLPLESIAARVASRPRAPKRLCADLHLQRAQGLQLARQCSVEPTAPSSSSKIRSSWRPGKGRVGSRPTLSTNAHRHARHHDGPRAVAAHHAGADGSVRQNRRELVCEFACRCSSSTSIGKLSESRIRRRATTVRVAIRSCADGPTALARMLPPPAAPESRRALRSRCS